MIFDPRLKVMDTLRKGSNNCKVAEVNFSELVGTWTNPRAAVIVMLLHNPQDRQRVPFLLNGQEILVGVLQSCRNLVQVRS